MSESLCGLVWLYDEGIQHTLQFSEVLGFPLK